MRRAVHEHALITARRYSDGCVTAFGRRGSSALFFRITVMLCEPHRVVGGTKCPYFPKGRR